MVVPHGLMCIMLVPSGKLRILNANERCFECIRNSLLRSGGNFVRRHYYETITLKFAGSPFRKQARAHVSLHGKMMILNLMKDLFNAGYILCTSSNLVQVHNNSTFFFNTKIDAPNVKSNFCCVGLSRTSLVHLIDCSDSISQDICLALKGCYKRGIKWSNQINEHCFEIKLNDKPWRSTGEVKQDGRIAMMSIFKTFLKHNFIFYTRVNIKDSVDSIIFIQLGSQETVPVDSTSFNLFVMSLDASDSMRFTNAPVWITDQVTRVSESTYEIQQESSSTDSIQLKFVGSPWIAVNAAEAVKSRLLLCKIFERFFNLGYQVLATVDMSKKLSSKSCFFLQQCLPYKSPVVSCISINSSDRIRFINFPKSESIILINVARIYYDGDCKQLQVDETETDEVKLSGKPWMSDGSDSVNGSVVMSYLLSMLKDQLGYYLFSSATVSGKQSGDDNPTPLKTHSWFFVKHK